MWNSWIKQLQSLAYYSVGTAPAKCSKFYGIIQLQQVEESLVKPPFIILCFPWKFKLLDFERCPLFSYRSVIF